MIGLPPAVNIINRIPENPNLEITGIIKKETVLSGLHHNYYRSIA